MRLVVDRAHRHICGIVFYADKRTLLSHKGLCCDHVQHYLASTVTQCSDCNTSSTPPPPIRLVSITPLHGVFTNAVYIDYIDNFYLQDAILFHVMDVATLYFATYVVSFTSLDEAFYALELICISQFGPLNTVYGDGPFQTTAFQLFLSK